MPLNLLQSIIQAWRTQTSEVEASVALHTKCPEIMYGNRSSKKYNFVVVVLYSVQHSSMAAAETEKFWLTRI